MTTERPNGITTALASCVQVLSTAIEDLEVKNSVLAHERADQRKTVTNLNSYRSKLEKEIRDLRATNRDLELAVGQANARELEELRAADEAKVEQEDVEELIAERDKARTDFRKAKAAQHSAEREASTAEESLKRAEKQLTATIGRLQESQNALAASEKRLADREAELESLRLANIDLTDQAAGADAAHHALGTAEKLATEYRTKFELEQKRAAGLQAELDTTQERVVTLETELAYARQSTTLPELTPDLAELRSRLDRAIRNFEDHPEKTVKDLAAALQHLTTIERKN